MGGARTRRRLGGGRTGRGSPGREAVREALDVLNDVTGEEEGNAAESDRLLSDVARTRPRLRTWVSGRRAQSRRECETIAAPRPDGDPAEVDAVNVGQRLGWVIGPLCRQWAGEEDVVYQAYCEAFGRALHRAARSQR